MPICFCYVDEAGSTGKLPSATSPIQPVFAVAGIIIDEAALDWLTHRFLEIKQTFFPRRFGSLDHRLDAMLDEVKGSSVRKQVRSGSRRERRHAIGFLDKVVSSLERVGAQIVGRLWIKGIDEPFNGTSVYTYSIQEIFRYTNSYLGSENRHAVVIPDSRSKAKNTKVSHSIFTQQYKRSGDEYPRILEMPVFGHSDNHAGIQISDLICSGLLFPMATYTYCLGHVDNVHVHRDYEYLKDRFGSRLERMQYRFCEGGNWQGGVTVSDQLTQRSGGALFRT